MATGQTSGRTAQGIDAWVLRIDRAGNELSSWITGGPDTDRAFGIHPLPDGGCIIGGMSGTSYPEGYDSFIGRLDAEGKRVWWRQPRRAGFQVVHDIRPLAAGTLLAIGYGHVNRKQGIDGVAQRFTADGKFAVEENFGGPTYDRSNHGLILDDGSIAVIGYTQRPGATDEEHEWDMVVYRLDSAARLRSALRFGGAGVEFGRGIAGTLNDVWVAGHTSTGRNGSSILLVRLDYTPR
jgi:hypothetical protein